MKSLIRRRADSDTVRLDDSHLPSTSGFRMIALLEVQMVLLFAQRGGILSNKQAMQINRRVYDAARKIAGITDDDVNIAVSSFLAVVREVCDSETERRFLKLEQLRAADDQLLLEPVTRRGEE